MEHWAMTYMGKPWVKGASGPDSFDCWGLVRYVQRQHYGISLEHVPVDFSSHAAILRTFIMTKEHDNWRPVDRPEDGDIVEMGSSRHPHHIGVWLDVDSGGVLHCVEGAGVGFQRKASLRVFGWSKITYMRHITK